jgi:hypothetical protein
MTHPSPTTPRNTHPITRKIALATAFFPSWIDSVERIAARIGLPYTPVFAEMSMDGASLLTALEHLGADLDIDEAEVYWGLARPDAASFAPLDRLPATGREMIASDFQGAIGLTLDGRRWLATTRPTCPRTSAEFVPPCGC